MNRVVVSLPESSNEFQVLQAEEARAAARQLGLAVEVLNADRNAVLQVQQVLQALRSEPLPRAVVVEPVAAEAAEKVIRKAATSGMASALLNCSVDWLDRLRSSWPGAPIFRLGSDQVEIGRIQGRQFRSLLPAGGQVLYIHGPEGTPAARERSQGLAESLHGSGIRMTTLHGHWSEESAERAVKSWLRLRAAEVPGIDLVAAQDDAMARGARRALLASEGGSRWARVPFLGIDGVPGEGQRLVDQGELTATVVMPSNTGAALEHVDRWLRDGVVPPSNVVMPVRPYPDIPQMLRAGRIVA